MTQNIVFLIDSYTGPWAGTERQLWYLIEDLDRRRFEPVLVALRHSDYSRNAPAWPCQFNVIGVTSLASLNGAGVNQAGAVPAQAQDGYCARFLS